ncbi:class II aldolase/adducin family protein [Parasulfitobacter algicola]|uniref:Class II aldolase n=1 Tax=Parasulfitobacter algicola TaxID=2614809 RepID=A0ABX2IL01_9RHOB|nr:class II aldolase/adducin family protein [Sulfitobacter algicola]NSX53532.1 class II aldolase [Sulfitobacter algicola]
MDDLLTPEFRAFSARLGQDPLRVQGPGGNTSIKSDDIMWIKASGTELADAEHKSIFVSVDRNAAKAEAAGAGDGSCKATVLDKTNTLRPSIETTFHAALDWPVVAHTHSIATLVHAISPEGRLAAREKLNGLSAVFVPYAKPGLPLTREILARVTPQTQVIVLENHGLICCGSTVAETDQIMGVVEMRLSMPKQSRPKTPQGPLQDGFERVGESWMAFDARITNFVLSGSYYPDHVVFLGPALPENDHNGQPPVFLVQGEGVYLRDGATSSQRAMIRCLSDCLVRLPENWTAQPIGADSEAELMNWDAEKYRQTLAART